MSDEFEELDFDLDDEAEVIEETDKIPSGDKINLFFQSTIGPTQQQEKLMVASEAPVADLKYTISQIFSIDAQDFHLSYLGRTLDPDDIISNYDMEDGDTILIIPVSTAG